MELMNPEEAWDSEVILNGAKTVGCNGSTSRDVTPKGICEHAKRILNQKFCANRMNGL
jgi:hypothetical protein